MDLGESRRIRSAGASFLQDVRSWIWLPREVVVSVSEDGVVFREIARIVHEVSAETDGIVLEDLVADLGGLDGIEARHVRIRALNYGTIPGGHLGAGDAAWIFVDEILIE